MKTQCEKLLDYMKEHGSVTGMESIMQLGVMNYKGRINDLRRLGVPIKTTMETALPVNDVRRIVEQAAEALSTYEVTAIPPDGSVPDDSEYLIKLFIDAKPLRAVAPGPLRSISMRERLMNLPAADVRPVVLGTWRQIGPKEAVCSVCNNVTLTNGIDRTGHANIHKALYHFCPNCGADMREANDEKA